MKMTTGLELDLFWTKTKTTESVDFSPKKNVCGVDFLLFDSAVSP